MIDLASVTVDDFRVRQGEEFVLFPEQEGLAGQVALTLAEVTDQSREHMTYTGRIPFSLLFAGPEGLYVPQRIYTLENPTMGRMDLFLVPMAPDGQKSLFECVFT